MPDTTLDVSTRTSLRRGDRLTEAENLSTGSHLGEGVRVPDTPKVGAELTGRFEGGVQEGVIHERHSLVGAAQRGGDEYLLQQ